MSATVPLTFNNTSFVASGPATFSGAGTLRLLDQQYWAASAAYTSTPLALSDLGSFDLRFRFSLANGSADGLALVLQSSAAGNQALGWFGGYLGYGGVAPSIAVELRSWTLNRLQIGLNGDVDAGPWQGMGALSSGAEGDVRIRYDLPTQEFTAVARAGKYMAAVTMWVDLASLLGDSPYLGFTAGSGLATSTEEVTRFSLSPVAAAGPGGLLTHLEVTGQGAVASFGDGRTYVTAAAANAYVLGGNGDNHVRGSLSGSVVQLGHGGDIVRLEGDGNYVTVGWGNNTVTLIGNGSYLETGDGNNTIAVRGDGNTVYTGAGADVLTLNGVGNGVDAGAGDNRVSVFGSGNTIVTGGGADRILVDGNSVVYAGDGNDLLRIQGSGNQVDAGSGNDTIYATGTGSIFVLNRAGQGTDDIFGNVIQANHRLDLRDALAATVWDGSPGSVWSYVKISGVGGNTVVFINPTGMPGDPDYAVAVLHQGVASAAAMQAHMIWA